ncbi:hypothetical protein [Halanaerobacter jeridensis]|uniref:Beta-barrel porin 2 n=1 Tax=Halanaerobacter jeridensis TaxID=706427 RepID=A0A938XQ73_9FIRM|nr:hypothetical protein [Halanaerobacter jeridensis]MBM7555280.1 hypothetical protein [Halanaerobacter jeridensis]
MKRFTFIMLSMVLIISLLGTSVQAAESAFGAKNSDDKSSTESAFSSSSFGSQTEEKLSWSGTLELDTRAILDKNGTSDIYSDPILDLNLNYTKGNSEIDVTLNFDENADDNVKIEEATMRFYYDNYDLVVGKKKEVWGKGDKLHVVDNLNGEDLTDFINPDYLDRQIGEEMFKMNYYLGRGTLEAVYTPNFTPDNLATSGHWVTNEIQQMNDLEPVLIDQFGIASATEVKGDLEKNSQQEIEDGQFGLRYTNSKAGYDYGFSFYRGYLKRPSMDEKAIEKLKNDYKTNSKTNYSDAKSFLYDLNLHYDQVSVFGAEMSSVIAGINSRAELAYYRTDDTSGDDPEVRNNKIAWLIGGDRNLPLHNVNVNLQVKSEYILDHEEIEDNSYDIQQNQDNEYFTNLLSLEVSDEFKNQTVLPAVTLIYNLEREDYVLDNELELKLKDDTSLILNYKLFEGENHTDFGQFDENDYLSAKFKYDF